jgi:glyoxalase family protein
MEAHIRGLHHVTAIASDPQPNVDFYTGLLGLRLVKRTVNFDDPGTYHLYYGDGVGSPGTILTFFAWPGARPGRQGVGHSVAVALTIPTASLGYWLQRLVERGIQHQGPEKRFDEQVVRLRDPDGLPVELIAQANTPPVVAWEQSDVPIENAIRGVHSATLWVETLEPSAALLTDTLGFRHIGEEDGRVRFTTGEDVSGNVIDIRAASGFWSGTTSPGTIHHLAWRTATNADQLEWRGRLTSAGLEVTPVLDRQYFHSIYFREPGNVLFEIATDPPGFAVDEPVNQLGSQLKLPSWLESRRAEIERGLPAIHMPGDSVSAARSAEPELAFVHRFVPASDSGDAPTLLLLHGTGGDETDLLDVGKALLPSANLLSPRGRVLENGMPRFFRRLAEGVFDRENLIAETHALAAFLSAAVDQYELDPQRVVAVGYSNGANIAASLLLLHPDVLTTAVLFRPMVPLEPDLVPDLSGTHVFIGAARRDELIPVEGTERLASLLEGFGADVKIAWQPGGHALTQEDLRAARAWIGRRSRHLPTS